MLGRSPGARRLGCANLAHAVAAMPDADKMSIVEARAPNIGVVTAYNDMLSAHQPYERFPAVIRDAARALGATAQVAGGVPAMCDGITQGLPGMDLSLFSRDTIAMGTAIALSHDVFDGALLLGICDKIVPGLLIGALHFGHLPCVFVPGGPMASGIPNAEKTRVRELHALGQVGRAELMASESASYHSPGTCTFYGTANSNQMLLEAMGLHVPGAAFVHPHAELREALTREAVRLVLANARWQPAATESEGRARLTPIGRLVDERSIVNAMVALLATGGSTNHLIHWVAVARSAGIVIDWSDFADLSQATPLVARVYPNGSADVNQFQAAGGPGFVIRELIEAGCLHPDVATVSSGGLADYARVPERGPSGLAWRDLAPASGDDSVLRPASAPFSEEGGLKLLTGNCGRAVIKVSSVPRDRWIVEAPARVFDSQEAMLEAFAAGDLDRDVVVVIRFQGPRSNGMPELHKLTPPLGALQKKGFHVALVTDGRMSGASGQIPAAIHVSPEVLAGGSLGRVRDGDRIRLDAVAGRLEALVAKDEWERREAPGSRRAPGRRQRPRPRPRAFRRHAKERRFGRTGSLHMALISTGAMLDPLELARHGPVIPVIVIERVEHAVPMARALVEGGVRVLEVTLRTPAGLASIEAIARAVPEAIVGAGTVRSPAEARAAHAAGARFAVSPGWLASVAAACRELQLALLPGVATATEVMQAAEDGLRFLKFFPAGAAGGVAMLKAWASPFADIAFCPTGGITAASAPDYLALGNVKVVGGSWLTPADALAGGDWPRIARLAKEAAALRA